MAKGEVSGSSGNASGDQGSCVKGKPGNNTFYEEGYSGLGVKKTTAGTPTAAANHSQKGANKGGL